MNIFATNSNPKKCAQYLDDKRVIKMILESTQMLCTAINVNGGKTPYKSTHINHPCSIWTRENFGNWMWLYDHAVALCVEYKKRFNKTHKCEENVLWALQWPTSYFKPGKRTAFPNCTTYKDEPDVHKAYKLYLHDKWKNDKLKPTWYRKNEENIND